MQAEKRLFDNSPWKLECWGWKLARVRTWRGTKASQRPIPGDPAHTNNKHCLRISENGTQSQFFPPSVVSSQTFLCLAVDTALTVLPATPCCRFKQAGISAGCVSTQWEKQNSGKERHAGVTHQVREFILGNHGSNKIFHDSSISPTEAGIYLQAVYMTVVVLSSLYSKFSSPYCPWGHQLYRTFVCLVSASIIKWIL